MTTLAFPVSTNTSVTAHSCAAVRDLLISLTASAMAVTACLFFWEQLHHGFVIPVMLCGAIVGADALAWIRGHVGPFDPIGILGLIGLHFYFFAPLLHVISGWWMSFVVPPDDWRPWLETMAWINVVGLLIYRVGRAVFTAAWRPTPSATIWQLDRSRFVLACGSAMAVSAATQAMIYAHFGGISGFIQAYTETADNFIGFGHLFTISETFPMLAVLSYGVWSMGHARRRTWPVVVGVIVGFVVLKFVFGGLKGNRGHLIYGMFWVLGIVHLWIRPLSKKVLVAGGLAGLAFMYAYGYYKNYGVEALAAIRGQEVTREISDEMNRSISYVLLGDLARADVQALILHRLSPESGLLHYRPAGGESYLGALALFVPRSIWPDRPPTKLKAGTDALYGYGTYATESPATNAYGLAGEAMLNFGVVGAWLSFLALAAIVVWARRWPAGLVPTDMRQLLVPFVYSLVFMALIWDSEILVVYAFKESLVPAMVLWCGSRKVPRKLTICEEVRA